MSYSDRNNVINEIENALGSDGTRALAEAMYELMRADERIDYDDHRGLYIREDVDLLSVAEEVIDGAKEAQKIVLTSHSATDAAEAAESRAIAKDQVEGELTKWTFDDNSVLAVSSGSEMFSLDADDADSIRSYGEFAGESEAAEVARLLEALED